jgi:hypothetical protein
MNDESGGAGTAKAWDTLEGAGGMEGRKMKRLGKIVALVVGPLCSRKVRVALATVIAAYAGRAGLGWDEQMVLTVLSVGVALILGIAHEDAGAKSAGQADGAEDITQ